MHAGAGQNGDVSRLLTFVLSILFAVCLMCCAARADTRSFCSDVFVGSQQSLNLTSADNLKFGTKSANQCVSHVAVCVRR